jgi:transposase
MDASEQNPDGQVSRKEFERLRDALDRAYDAIAELKKENAELKKENAELKKENPNRTAKVNEPYSMRSEEQRQKTSRKKRKESKKQRRGRIANEEKLKRAQRTEDVYPDGVPHDQCTLSHVRVVWRLSHGSSGHAILVAYRVFRSGKQFGKIPGAFGRSEFGMEIVVTLAQLVYGMGQSFDQACQVIGFFQNLKLSKSQADALLRQLSHYWADEFEVLCTLLANSLVVHADETSWSIHSVWAFLSEKARLLFFGVHKDGATLETILDPELFQGLLFSDDYAVYENFSKAQKCWAHLLRKAIKLTLQSPQDVRHRAFADGLLAIYHQAQKVKRDKRYGDATRQGKVAKLADELFDLCDPVWREKPSLKDPLEHDRCNLALEILRLLEKEELFTFVTAPAVEQPNGTKQTMGGTNNEVERILRRPARARDTGQTSKTLVGARRTSILTSVLESLRLYLPTYTLSSVLEEVQCWQKAGKSCFRQLLEKLKLSLPDQSVLDRLFPEPSG